MTNTERGVREWPVARYATKIWSEVNVAVVAVMVLRLAWKVLILRMTRISFLQKKRKVNVSIIINLHVGEVVKCPHRGNLPWVPSVLNDSNLGAFHAALFLERTSCLALFLFSCIAVNFFAARWWGIGDEHWEITLRRCRLRRGRLP